MIHFLKSKPFLTDLIPENHVDIHSHLLPGIDDGAATIDDSVTLLSQMKNIGFNNIITTPHIITHVWDNTSESIIQKHAETVVEFDGKIAVNSFRFAAEYMMDAYFLKEIESKKLLTLKDPYVLVEVSYLSPPIQLYDIIFELQLAGYTPVLAHPERYLFYHFNFSEYKKLKKSGCQFQLNLLSAVGYYGINVAKIADKLLGENLIDFVGSDVHHQNHIDAFNKKVVLKNLKPLEVAIANNLFFLE